MAVTAAQLVVRVTGETKSAESSLGSLNQKVKDSGGFFHNLLGTALGTFAGMMGVQGVTAAFGFLKDQLVDTVKAGIDAQQAQAQLTQGLISTHDASGETTQSLEELAEKYSKVTTFSKTAIEQSEAISLTFTNIGRDVFPAATMAAEDLATRMGESLPSATLQLDKALGNPVQGITALTRVGVVLTDQQKEQIKQMVKAGDTAGAQGIILKELQKEFGGSATAAGKTFGGQLQILSNQLEDTKEKIGQKLLPVLGQMLSAVMPLVSSLGTLVTQGLSALSDFLTNTVIPALSGVTPLFSSLGTTIQSQVLPIAQQLGSGIASAVKTALPILSSLWVIFSKDILPAVRQLLPVVIGLALSIGQTLGGIIRQIMPVLAGFAAWFLKEGVPALKSLADFVEKNVLPVLATIVATVVSDVVPAIQSMADTVVKKVLPAVEGLWNALAPKLVPIIQLLAGILSTVLPIAFNIVVTVITDVIGVVTTVIGWWDKFTSAIGFVMGKLHDFWSLLGSIKNFLAGEVVSAVQGVSSVFSTVFGGIEAIVKAPINAVIDGLNVLIGGLDSIGFTVPSWVPLIGGDGFHFSVPKIPHLAAGTDATAQAGFNLVGEKGPELVYLPKGVGVLPADKTSSLLHSSSVSGLPSGMTPSYGMASGSANGQPLQVNLYLDKTKLGQAVVQVIPNAVRHGTGARSF